MLSERPEAGLLALWLLSCSLGLHVSSAILVGYRSALELPEDMKYVRVMKSMTPKRVRVMCCRRAIAPSLMCRASSRESFERMGFEAIGLGGVFGGYREKNTAVYKRKTAGRDTRKEEDQKIKWFVR